jgi:chromosome segregation protein
MRFTRLDLERYGCFTGRVLHFRPDASLHVVIGPNERGKTTALSAITDLLFGFNTSTDYDYLHDRKTLRIGAELLLKDGSKLNFRRRKGTSNTILDANEQPMPDDLLAAIIGTVSREAFCREFGLTAASLRQGGDELVRAGGKLAETLAAGSAGLTTLSLLRKTIATEADELFTSRRSSSKEFYLALSRYDEADKTLRAAIVTADAMHVANEQLETAEADKKRIEQTHQARSTEQRRLERAIRTRNALLKTDKIRSEAGALSSLPEVAQASLKSWRKALDDYDKCVADLQSLERQDADDLGQINSLDIDESLLELGSRVDGLREALGGIKRSRDDLPKRLSELASAKTDLENIARRLGFNALVDMMDRRPNDIVLARASDLAEQRITAEGRLAESEGLLNKAVSEKDKIEHLPKSSGHTEDHTVFRQRLEAVSHIPSLADRLKREESSCGIEERELLIIGRGLVQKINTLNELSALPVPAFSVINEFTRALDELNQKKSQNDEIQRQLQQKLAALTTKIERLKQDGTEVTREDLTEARLQRETALAELNQSLDEELDARRTSFKKVVSVSKRIDSVTDHLLGDQERATQLQTHRYDYADATQALASAQADEELISGRMAQFEIDWSNAWESAQVVPTSPTEMMSWRQKFEALLESITKVRKRREDLAPLREDLDEGAKALAALMTDYGRPRDRTIAAQILYSEAANWFSDLQENWAALREQKAKLEAAATAVEQAKVEHEKWQLKIREVSLLWSDVVSAIGLQSMASPKDVRTAVGLWESIAAPKQTYDDRTHRTVAMQSDIDRFVQDVRAVATAASSDLHGEAEDVLKALTERLTQSRQAAQTRDVLKRQMEARLRGKSELLNVQSHLVDTLNVARMALEAESNVSLIDKLVQLDARNDLKKKLVEQMDALTDSSDGLTEETLRAEQVGLDFDVVPGEIERLKLELNDLLAEMSNASVTVASAKRTVDDLSRGRNANVLARDLQEASGEIVSVTRKWITRAAAERLAGLAIERYRASVQDPLLARAAIYFKTATAEAFSGLTVDFDERDQPSLVALRPSREHVPVSGLSEGTRDQLFLSLRLSLLGMRTAEPLPFIADDLLSSFDDERTARTLSLLSEFGQSAQVMVFTHHSHVAEIARTIGADVEVLEL